MSDPHDIITPYATAETKKGQVTTMFDKIAPYYDYLNRFLSLGIDVWWRKKALRSIEFNNRAEVLDIATGTADLAIEMAKNYPLKHIFGVDVSANMLKIGEEKLKKKQVEHKVSLEVGDSEQLRFQNNYFDIITASFGVRNFENLDKGLAELYRIMNQNGQLMILEFSKPRAFPIKNIFNTYFKYVLPVIGKIKSKDPKAYNYLYESVQAFPDYEDFTQKLINVGFKNTKFIPLTFGICTIYLAKK